MKLDLKKIYYYLVALIAFVVLLWGAIDFVSASTSLVAGNIGRPSQTVDKGSEPSIEDYYQARVSQDRIFDSLSRILVSGVVFLFARYKTGKLEEK